MLATVNPEINVEDLMHRIRHEVALHKAQVHPAPNAIDSWTPHAQTVVALPRLPENKECVASKPEYTLAELLNYDDDCFVRSAYLAILRREPDAVGNAHYLTALRTGQLSKTEILGRVRYSPEGKVCAVQVRGLLLPFVVQSAYRIPVLGYGVALANFVLRLPVIVRNRVSFEANTLRQQREQVAQLNALAAQIESAINNVQNSFVDCDLQFGQRIQEKIALAAIVERLSNEMSGKAGNSNLIALALELEAIRSSTAPRQHVDALRQQVLLELPSKAETALVESLMGALAQKAAMAQVEALAAQTEALAAQTGEQILRLTQAVETKAAITQVEALAAQTSEQVFSLSKALEIKADNERLTQLTNHLVELVQRKADAAELAAVATRLGEELAQKAAVAQVEALAAQTSQQVLGLSQTVETKADAATTHQETRKIQRQILDHKHNILDQQRRLALLLEEARKRLPEPISTEQIENMVVEEDHLLDAFYVSFEDRFRGTREDIKQRVAIYLPFVKEAKAGTKNAPILDVGCGRGEWLELLRENDLVARGVDLNRVMVSQCQELGLEVAEADAIAYLRKLKANSLGAVTGMHIIEHIPFKRLIALFDEVLRVLKPGGVAIFETPNPENLQVGACGFYTDPTHLNPLPPHLTDALLELRGFVRPVILRPGQADRRQYAPQMVPNDLPGATSINPMVEVVRDNFYVSPDYAVIAHKA